MAIICESKLWKKKLGDWVINPYVGCEHGCKHCYCPAMPATARKAQIYAIIYRDSR